MVMQSPKFSLHVDDTMTPYNAPMIFHDCVQLIYMRISEFQMLLMLLISARKKSIGDAVVFGPMVFLCVFVMQKNLLLYGCKNWRRAPARWNPGYPSLSIQLPWWVRFEITKIHENLFRTETKALNNLQQFHHQNQMFFVTFSLKFSASGCRMCQPQVGLKKLRRLSLQ